MSSLPFKVLPAALEVQREVALRLRGIKSLLRWLHRRDLILLVNWSQLPTPAALQIVPFSLHRRLPLRLSFPCSHLLIAVERVPNGPISVPVPIVIRSRCTRTPSPPFFSMHRFDIFPSLFLSFQPFYTQRHLFLIFLFSQPHVIHSIISLTNWSCLFFSHFLLTTSAGLRGMRAI
jgi:hypothetical protein